MKIANFFILIFIIQSSLAQEFKKNSVLKKGEFHKVAIASSGIYKLDAKFFSDLGLDITEIDPTHINVYGNPGGMLPQANNAIRYDDLLKHNIWIKNTEEKKVFNQNDYILFYAEGPDKDIYDEINEMYLKETNLYADTNFYFIEIAGKKTIEIPTLNTLTTDTLRAIHNFTYSYYREKEAFNLLSSGRDWYGDKFTYPDEAKKTFTLGSYSPIPDTEIKLYLKAMNRETVDVNFSIELDGKKLGEMPIGAATRAAFGNKGIEITWFKYFDSSPFAEKPLNLALTLETIGNDAEAYLDFAAVQFEAPLQWQGKSFHFRFLNHKEVDSDVFALSRLPKDAMVWKLGEPGKPEAMTLSFTDSTAYFEDLSDNAKYIAFIPNEVPTPYALGKVESQNLHGLNPAQLIIVTPDSLKHEAIRLAEHRNNIDGVSTEVVILEQIYNEFSSGRREVTAIRDFMRMLYENSSLSKKIEYLLLFGDASYDYKGIENGQENLVPIYQSRSSLHTVHSYASDDYFGFLDSNEGDWAEGTTASNQIHLLDIGIGRLPIRNTREAKDIVDKLIAYQSPSTLGRWRSELGFIADNGDENKHQLRSDFLASQMENQYPDFIPERLFVGAFPIETQGSSKTSIAARKKLEEFVADGKLIIDYIGHGSEGGWTNEKILTNGQVLNWRNNRNMPLFITATCEYGRFDDWKRRSGAELSLMNPLGGPIGLLTTTRPVVASTNFDLSSAFYDVAFAPINDEMPRLGDIMRLTKNNSISGTLNRNFSLLGDPSMKLAYPEYKIFITEISGQNPEEDSLKLAGEVTVKGFVGKKENRIYKQFNGILETIIYGAPVEKKITDESGDMYYTNRETILYNGKSSIVDGSFEFRFTVPKNSTVSDSSFLMSFYAGDIILNADANGHLAFRSKFDNGNNVDIDETPPSVQLYLNSPDFKPGDETDSKPVLFAIISDESGINTTDVSKPIKVIIDDDSSMIFNLNSYYESDLDTYQSGRVQFQLPELDAGVHFLTLEVWDNAGNNTATGLYFSVSDGLITVLENLIVHPNPSFGEVNFTFPNNNEEPTGYDVQIHIYSATAEIIEVIEGSFEKTNTSLNTLVWNGKNSNGYKLNSGTYFYEITLTSHEEAKIENKTGQFVILR